MSGYEEITEWIDDNYDPRDFDSFEDWLSAIEADFIENGRSPLSDIFDDADYARLEAEYRPEFETPDYEGFFEEEPEPSYIADFFRRFE